jgi:hypothetical protein
MIARRLIERLKRTVFRTADQRAEKQNELNSANALSRTPYTPSAGRFVPQQRPADQSGQPAVRIANQSSVKKIERIDRQKCRAKD